MSRVPHQEMTPFQVCTPAQAYVPWGLECRFPTSTPNYSGSACPRGRGQRAWPCCGTPPPPKGGCSLLCPLSGLTQAHLFVLLPSHSALSRSSSPPPTHPSAPPGGHPPNVGTRAASRLRLPRGSGAKLKPPAQHARLIVGLPPAPARQPHGGRYFRKPSFQTHCARLCFVARQAAHSRAAPSTQGVAVCLREAGQGAGPGTCASLRVPLSIDLKKKGNETSQPPAQHLPHPLRKNSAGAAASPP